MTIKELEYELNIKSSECEMLNNTLMEMYRKNKSSNAIDSVRSEVIDKMNEISKLREEITKLSEIEAEFSFYDNVRKEDACNKIDLKGAPNDKCESKCGNCSCDKNLSHESFYDAKKKFDKVRESIDKISLSDDRIMSNLFLVDMSSLGIGDSFVKSVCFNLEEKEVYMDVYDFLVTMDSWDNSFVETKTPVINVLEKFKTNEYRFDFSIYRITRDGKTVYVEKYKDCTIEEIHRNNLDYEKSDFSKFSLRIKYNNVSYETAN